MALTSWRACTTLTRAAVVRAGGKSLTGVGSRDSGWAGGQTARTGSYLQEFYCTREQKTKLSEGGRGSHVRFYRAAVLFAY